MVIQKFDIIVKSLIRFYLLFQCYIFMLKVNLSLLSRKLWLNLKVKSFNSKLKYYFPAAGSFSLFYSWLLINFRRTVQEICIPAGRMGFEESIH